MILRNWMMNIYLIKLQNVFTILKIKQFVVNNPLNSLKKPIQVKCKLSFKNKIFITANKK